MLVAPFVATLFAVLTKIIDLTYQSAQISGNGQFAQTQDTVYEDTPFALDILELASSIETWTLFLVFLFAIAGAINASGSSGGR